MQLCIQPDLVELSCLQIANQFFKNCFMLCSSDNHNHIFVSISWMYHGIVVIVQLPMNHYYTTLSSHSEQLIPSYLAGLEIFESFYLIWSVDAMCWQDLSTVINFVRTIMNVSQICYHTINITNYNCTISIFAGDRIQFILKCVIVWNLIFWVVWWQQS